MQMYTARYCTQNRDPKVQVRARTVVAKPVCNIKGRITISTNQTAQMPQGLNHQPKNTEGLSMDQAGITGRGAPCSLMSQHTGMLGYLGRCGWVGWAASS